MGISQRGRQVQESPLRKLIGLAKQAEASGKKVYYLNIGEPDDFPPTDIFYTFLNIERQKIKYAPSPGNQRLLEAWQKFYHDQGFNLADSEIIITSGASEALLFAFAAVADPGDEIIVFEPFYPNYTSLATLLGIKLRAITLIRREGKYYLPRREVIEKQINHRTKAIVFDNPSNPSGHLYTESELRLLSEIAIRKNLMLISDEVYRELVYEGKPASLLENAEIKDNAIVVDSVSKRFSLCGLRMGCLVSRNPEVLSAVNRFAQGRLSAPLLDQQAVIPVLLNSQTYIKQLTETFTGRRQVLMNSLSNISGVEISIPQGSFYNFVRIKKESEEFARWLLTDFSYNNQTVVIAPGTGFYLKPESGQYDFRIAFVLDIHELEPALEVLKQALLQYNK